LEMEGGTVFHFVTEGIEAALDQARAAARGKDVSDDLTTRWLATRPRRGCRR
jgi:hypothetical protein